MPASTICDFRVLAHEEVLIGRDESEAPAGGVGVVRAVWCHGDGAADPFRTTQDPFCRRVERGVEVMEGRDGDWRCARRLGGGSRPAPARH